VSQAEDVPLTKILREQPEMMLAPLAAQVAMQGTIGGGLKGSYESAQRMAEPQADPLKQKVYPKRKPSQPLLPHRPQGS